MEFNLTRPDHEQPFKYVLELDEEFLLNVMAGLDRVYTDMDRTLTEHANCDRLSPNGCVTDAKSCYDVFIEAHGTMLQLAKFMGEARFVREHREAKSQVSFQQLRREAREVVAAAQRTMLPTAQYAVLGPVGTCPDEAYEGEDLATRTQKVDLPLFTTDPEGLCHFCGGLEGQHTLRNCLGQIPQAPVEVVSDTSQIQDPQSDVGNNKPPQEGM